MISCLFEFVQVALLANFERMAGGREKKVVLERDGGGDILVGFTS